MVKTVPPVVALEAPPLRLVEVSLVVVLRVLLLLLPVADLALAALVQAIPEEGSEARAVACSATSPLLPGVLALAPVDSAPGVVGLAQGPAQVPPALALAVAQARLSNNKCRPLMAPPALPSALSLKRITAPT